MNDVTRLDHSEDDWASAPAPEPGPKPSASGWLEAVTDLGMMVETARIMGRHLLGGIPWAAENEPTSLVAMSVLIQDLRRDLAMTEALLARAAGRALAEDERLKGELPDGRTYQVSKGKDRKEWNHEAWKADVRRQVLSGVGGEVVDTATGETVDVPGLLAAVQDVVSAAAPKVTGLKALGLKADDYCTTVSGTWSVRIFQSTDIQEN